MNSKLAWASLLGSFAIISASQPAWAALPEDKGASAALSTETADPGSMTTIENSNPYSAIVARNVFRLVPPPPPPPPPTNDTAALVGTLKLTGFIKISGEPLRALFVNSPNAKDPKGETSYFSLTEGEKDGSLELLKILEDKESAEVIHAGIRSTVLLKDSKPTSTGPSPAGVVPGAPPGFPPGVQPPQGFPPRPGAVAAAAPANIAQPQPDTSSGVMVAGAAPITPAQVTPGQTGNVNPAGMNQIPTRTLRGNTPVQAAAPAYQPQSLEESAALMLIDAQAHQKEINNGTFPPMPPMPGMPGGNR